MKTKNKPLRIILASVILLVILGGAIGLITWAALRKTPETGKNVGSEATLYTRDGDDYICFGSYAKTIKAEDVTVSSTADENGYYTGSDGEKYVKKAAAPFRSNYTFSNGTTIANATEYYFKVEPIKWQVLKEENGTAMLLAQDILTARVYHTGDKNNYASSDIRSWLNGTFLTTAFTEAAQGIIQTTEVDNSAATTNSLANEHVCANTSDKIYLLSYQDLTNTNYGFSSSDSADASRKKAPTDYAKATGAFWNAEQAAGIWWSRSPHANYQNSVLCVERDGHISDPHVDDSNVIVDFRRGVDTCFGVVPVLTIKL